MLEDGEARLHLEEKQQVYCFKPDLKLQLNQTALSEHVKLVCHEPEDDEELRDIL